MDWRDEYDLAIAERNRLIMALTAAEKRAAELEARLAELEAAAHMPDDYEYGLESWINQHLYAAYIGAKFSDAVMAQIHEGRLTFPESPAARRAAELEARLAELERRPSSGTLGDLYDWIDRAIEGTADLKETIGKAVDVYEWRPVTERRYNDGNERPEYYADVELLIVGFMNDSGQWVYNEDLPGFRSPVRGWRPLPPPPQGEAQ